MNRLALVTGVVVVVGGACAAREDAPLDFGAAIATEPVTDIRQLRFTPDGERVFYLTTSGDRVDVKVLSLRDGAIALVLANLPAVVRFELPSRGAEGFILTEARELARLSLGASVLTPIADHVVTFEPSSDGRAVAIENDQAQDGFFVRDLPSGRDQVFPTGSPSFFSDDGQSILATIPSDASGFESIRWSYLVINRADGHSEALPRKLNIFHVARWTAGKPAVVVANTEEVEKLAIIDVEANTTRPLLAMEGFQFVAGTATTAANADPTVVLVWNDRCLRRERDFESEFCASREAALWQVDTGSGAATKVGQAPRTLPTAVSPDGRRVVVHHEGKFYLKELTPI